MQFETILKQLEEQDAQVKTAQEAAPTSQAPASQEALKASLDRILEKNAANPQSGDPVDALIKQAQELAGIDKAAEVEQAAVCGRAFGDALINTLSAYDAAVKTAALQEQATLGENAIVENLVKEAAQAGYANTVDKIQAASQEKTASQTDVEGLVKQAAETGYAATQQKLAAAQNQDVEGLVKQAAEAGYAATQEKIAAVQYEAGQEQALQDIYANATNEFVKGAQEADLLVKQAASAQ